MDQKHYAVILDSYTGYTAIEFRNKNERKIIETLTPLLHPDYWCRFTDNEKELQDLYDVIEEYNEDYGTEHSCTDLITLLENL